MQTLRAAGRGVSGLAFSPTGGLAVADDAGFVSLWDLGPAEPTHRVHFRRPHRSRSLAFAPDGAALAGWDCGSGVVWSWGLGSDPPADGSRAPLTLALARMVGAWLTVRAHGELCVWDGGGLRCRLSGMQSWNKVASAGSSVVVHSQGWPARRPRPKLPPHLFTYDLSVMPAPSADPDVLRGASVRRGPGGLREQLQRPTQTPAAVVELPEGPARVSALALAPDGQSVLVADADRSCVRRLEIAGGRQTGAWQWPAGPVMTLAVAADGLTAAAGDSHGRVVLWDLA